MGERAAPLHTALAEFGVLLSLFVLILGGGGLWWIVNLTLVFYLDSETGEIIIWTRDAINIHTCQLHLRIGDLGCNLPKHSLLAHDAVGCIGHRS